MISQNFRHGHDQDAHVIWEVSDLPEVLPKITEEEEKFGPLLDDAVNHYVNYHLERVYRVLLGDIFNVMISHLAVIDAPEIYQRMRHALVGDKRSHVERHLLTFLHEFQTNLDAEVENYKIGDPAINPYGPYYFFMLEQNGEKIFSDPLKIDLTDEERREAEAAFCRENNRNPGDALECWSTGKLQFHFNSYLQKIYNRAMFMKQFIDFCETCPWINQSIEQFSAGARILNGEIEGVVLTYTGTTEMEATGFTLQGEYRAHAAAAYESRIVRAEPDANKGLPFTYDALENLRVVAVNGYVDASISGNNVLRVTSQDGSALQFLHEDSGTKVAIANIVPLPPAGANQVEKVYELTAKHFKKEVYFAKA